MRQTFRAALAALLLASCVPATATASPIQFVPAGDPIEAELRVLDLYPSAPGARVRLRHLNAAPWQVAELLAPRESLAAGAPELPGPAALAARRVLRALERDADTPAGALPRSTPRVLQRAWPGEERLELSVGAEGELDAARADGRTTHAWTDGSGAHVRAGAQVDGWLAYAHLWFGQLRGVRAFSDALVANSDLAATTEESYIAYSPGPRWSVMLGRDRWHWGPGEAGSLLLSRTSAPLNGAMFHARFEGVRADAFVLAATLDPGTGAQLAAHRLEWQPYDALRIGVAEAARYHAGGWQGAYLAGVIPYSIVQRLLDQDSRDALGELRNNVMVAGDASWRIAPGSKVYGEVLVDDLHARTATVPNKYAAQLGWTGAGEARGTRLTWTLEYAWISRYVYTSFFGAAYVSQGIPTGFPTGPDARRLRARVGWDVRPDLQVTALATRADRGEEGIADPFVPGGPVPDVNTLAGTAERTATVDAQVRWWPASGVDVALTAGHDRVENAAHVPGATATGWHGALAFRLSR